MSLDQYSQTPASNDLANYFQTGMAPSAVKTAGWDIMADLAASYGLPTSGGSANAQTITNTRKWGALDTKMFFCFLPGFVNTGPCTLSVDGLTAKNIYAHGAALLGGELSTTVPALVKYDGTQFNLLNPQAANGSFTGTLTGCDTGLTGTIDWVLGSDNYVTLNPSADILGTSNTSSLLMTGLPTAIYPTSPSYVTCVLWDNGDNRQALAQLVASSGTITFLAFKSATTSSYSSVAFTATGSKGLKNGTIIRYRLK